MSSTTILLGKGHLAVIHACMKDKILGPKGVHVYTRDTTLFGTNLCTCVVNQYDIIAIRLKKTAQVIDGVRGHHETETGP